VRDGDDSLLEGPYESLVTRALEKKRWRVWRTSTFDGE